MGMKRTGRGTWVRLVGVLVLSMLITLTGCAKKPSQSGTDPSRTPEPSKSSGPQTLNVALPGDINTLDPHGSELIVWTVVRNQMFDALVLKDPETLEMKPRLATEWSFENPTTLAMTLRTGVAFHDGSPVTGEDVKFSLERYRDKAAYGGRISALDHVEVVDATHVKLILKQHHAGIVDALGQVHIVKKGQPDDWYKQNAVGSGPFKLVEWQPGNAVRLQKNENYWRSGEPKVDFLTFKVMPQLETRIASLQAGDLDLMFDVDLKEVTRLKNNASVGVSTTKSGDFIYSIYVNTQKPGLNNPKVRQALAHALNRDAFNKNFQSGLLVNTNSALAPNNWAYDKSLDSKYSYDLKKAADLLAEAGYAGGKGLSLKLVYPAGYADLKAGSEIMHAALTELGIKAELQELELSAWAVAVARERTYDIGWDLRRNALDDPAVQYGTTGGFQPGTANRTGLLDTTLPDLTRALKEGEASQDKQARLALYKSVQSIWSENLHIIPVAVKPMAYAYRKNISGILEHPASHYQEFRTVQKGK